MVPSQRQDLAPSARGRFSIGRDRQLRDQFQARRDFGRGDPVARFRLQKNIGNFQMLKSRNNRTLIAYRSNRASDLGEASSSKHQLSAADESITRALTGAQYPGAPAKTDRREWFACATI